MNFLARSFHAESNGPLELFKRKRGSGRTFPRVARHKYTTSFWEQRFFFSKYEDKVRRLPKQLNECGVAAEGSQSPRRYFPPCSLWWCIANDSWRTRTKFTICFPLPQRLLTCVKEARHKNRQWLLLSIGIYSEMRVSGSTVSCQSLIIPADGISWHYNWVENEAARRIDRREALTIAQTPAVACCLSSRWWSLKQVSISPRDTRKSSLVGFFIILALWRLTTRPESTGIVSDSG